MASPLADSGVQAVRERWLTASRLYALVPQLALAGIVALGAAWAVASLTWPFGMDQGVLAWVGDVVVRGGMPYRDAFDVKGPLPHYLYALAQLAFGRHLWSVHVLDLIFVAVAAWCIVRLVGDLATPAAGRWAAAIYVLWYGSMSFMEMAQPDTWVGVLTLVALAPLLIAEDRYRYAHVAMAGAVLGACALTKPFYVALVALPLLHVFLYRKRTPLGLVRPALICVAAFIVPIAITIAWFAYRGALGELVNVHLLYTANVYSGIGNLALFSRVWGIVDYLWRGKIVAVSLPVILLGLTVLWRTRRPTALVMAAWVAAFVFFVGLQNMFFPYHWLPLGAPFAVLGGVGFHAVLREPAVKRAGEGVMGHLGAGRALGITLLIVVLFHATARPLVYAARWVAYETGVWSADKYHEALYVEGWVEPGPAIKTARYLRERTGPEDRIVVWGYDAAIPFMAGRPTTSRFGAWSGALVVGKSSPTRRQYRAEFVRSLEATPPMYLIMNANEHRFGQAEPELREQRLANFPELARFVRSRYRLDAVIEHMRVYRLATGAEARLPAPVLDVRQR